MSDKVPLPQKPKRKTAGIYIREDLLAGLDALKVETGWNRNRLVEFAVEEYLKRVS